FYDVSYFAITEKGHWISGNDAENYLHTGKLSFELQGSLISPTILNELVSCDLLYPVLHGTYGEDGTLQGLCEMVDLPYVGCNFRAAAVAMDKALTKALMKAYGIPTLDFITFTRAEWTKALSQEIIRRFTFPIFVKPTHLGSSAGVSKVDRIEDLQ